MKPWRYNYTVFMYVYIYIYIVHVSDSWSERLMLNLFSNVILCLITLEIRITSKTLVKHLSINWKVWTMYYV